MRSCAGSSRPFLPRRSVLLLSKIWPCVCQLWLCCSRGSPLFSPAHRQENRALLCWMETVLLYCLRKHRARPWIPAAGRVCSGNNSLQLFIHNGRGRGGPSTPAAEWQWEMMCEHNNSGNPRSEVPVRIIPSSRPRMSWMPDRKAEKCLGVAVANRFGDSLWKWRRLFLLIHRQLPFERLNAKGGWEGLCGRHFQRWQRKFLADSGNYSGYFQTSVCGVQLEI